MIPALVLSFLLVAPTSSPAPIRGWMIHGNLPTYHDLVLEKAKEYGINHLEISGDNPTTSEEMTGPAAIEVERMAKAARASGIDSYIWIREFNTNKKTLSLDPSSPEGAAFWNARKLALRNALAQAPDLTGIILSYASTPTEIWDVKDPSAFWQGMTMERRIKFVTEQFLSVAKELGKRVYVRDFNHSPQQLNWLIGGLKDGVGYTMHSKWVPQDWQLFYPHSPSIGAYGKTPQVIEADLGCEYWGQSMWPVCMVEYIKYRWDYDRTHGCLGVVARADRNEEPALETPSEINIYALSRYLQDSTTTPSQIYRDWNHKRYGLPPDSKASATLTSIYRNTFKQAQKMYFALGFWMNKDMTYIPDRVSSFERNIVGKSTTLWDKSPSIQRTANMLFHPTSVTYRKIMQERTQAIKLSEHNLKLFASISPQLNEKDATDWKVRLELANRFANVWYAMTDAIWSLRVAEEAKNRSTRTLAVIMSKADHFEELACTVEGPGPGKSIRQEMIQSSKKLAEDIRKRAQALSS